MLKKEIWPRGYHLRYRSIIASIVGFIALFVFFQVSGVKNNEKDFIEVSKFAIAVSIIFFLMISFDVFCNFKTYRRRKERECIIKNAVYSTKGMVHGIEEELIDHKGNRVYEPPNVTYTGLNTCYRISVSFINPEDGNKKIAISDLYEDNPKRFLKKSEIIVYAGKNTQPLVAIYKLK